MPLQFADRLNNVETSAIRELFKLLGKPGIISFAGGFPDSAMFDVDGIREASNAALAQDPGAALQYGATEGFGPLREQLAHFMGQKGAKDVAPDQLIVTTGSQQALDLIGKTMISPGDKVIVEGPTFLATIQCFRLYGPQVVAVPIDADGVQVDQLEALMVQHRPKRRDACARAMDATQSHPSPRPLVSPALHAHVTQLCIASLGSRIWHALSLPSMPCSNHGWGSIDFNGQYSGDYNDANALVACRELGEEAGMGVKCAGGEVVIVRVVIDAGKSRPCATAASTCATAASTCATAASSTTTLCAASPKEVAPRACSSPVACTHGRRIQR